MPKTHLKGVEGDMINTIMTAASFKMMKKLRQIWDAIYFALNLLTGYRLVKYTTLLIY